MKQKLNKKSIYALYILLKKLMNNTFLTEKYIYLYTHTCVCTHIHIWLDEIDNAHGADS